MAINTSVTLLKYASSCNLQKETATVVGTITLGGNATVIITSKALVGSPLTVSVAVLISDTASVVAGKIITALSALPAITSLFTVGGTSATVTLTNLVGREDDSTLNISIANGTCTGLTNALTSVNTTAGGTFTKLCDIVNYPDMGSSPSKLDTTDLTQPKFKTSILGLQEVPDLTFECNYDETVYNTINGLTSTYYFELVFGTADGLFVWQGQISVYANGGGVDEVRKMTITISASTAIDYFMN